MASAQTVRCTVSNCYFWGNDNYCEADSILVTSDRVGHEYPESVDAAQTDMLVNQIGETPANSCMETACKTFRNR